MNKRGQEKYLSIWNVLVWVIIFIVVGIGIFLFSSSGTDVRYEESEILNERILNCVVGVGVLNEDIFEEGYDLYEGCGLKEEKFDENGDFYFSINVGRLEDGKEIGELKAGNEENAIFCDLKDKDGSLVVCNLDSVIVESEKGLVKLEIFSVSRNRGENIK